ncbi:MAG: NusG domain II-containing protein [Candidatus Coatesbacteria bacterium]|nr:NusG domain II-containing protein [Candidatus Coatesbacteria bacterium]
MPDPNAKMVRPGDILLFVVLGASALLMIWAGSGTTSNSADVEIVVSGEVVHRAPLGQSFEFVAHGPLGDTKVQCEGGYAWIVSSCCPNKLCVKAGKVRAIGEIIVCVPNEVVVRIAGAGDVDAVAM